jgi:hypothetical protein
VIRHTSIRYSIVWMCAVSPVVNTSIISSCKKNFFSFPVAVKNSIKVGPLVFLAINVCNHGEHYETPCKTFVFQNVSAENDRWRVHLQKLTNLLPRRWSNTSSRKISPHYTNPNLENYKLDAPVRTSNLIISSSAWKFPEIIENFEIFAVNVFTLFKIR